MGTASKNPIDQKELLAVLCAEVKKSKGERFSLDQFLASTGLKNTDIYRYYPGWNDFLRAAGVEFNLRGEKIATQKLLADWGSVARKLGRIPSCKMYNIDGKFGMSTLARTFGGLRNVGGAFRQFAAGREEWADVLALFDARQTRTDKRRRRWITSRRRREDAVSFGAPLPHAELRNAPASESGVIYLFGVLAKQLGFSVEAIRPTFPDCIAKRRIAPGEWQNVRIEFEYESRNFREHRHDPEACDLIVCWSHNWPDCPESLEVIALSEELKKL